MDWRSWFATKAKLTGKKLQLAVAACEENVIESVAELRALASRNRQEYEAAFPFAGVRFAITEALDNQQDEDADASSVTKASMSRTRTVRSSGYEEDKW